MLLQPNTRKCDAVTTYELGNELVIFLEHTGELLRLNPTAAVVWKGLRSGMPSTEIVESLARTLEFPPNISRATSNGSSPALKKPVFFANMRNAPRINNRSHLRSPVCPPPCAGPCSPGNVATESPTSNSG